MLFPKEVDEILNLLTEGILITDKIGNHLYVNRSYERFAETSRENILSKNIYQLKEEGFFNIFLNPDVVQNRRKATAIQTLHQGITVVLDANPIFDHQGDVQLVVTFVRDSSSIDALRQQVSMQEELLSAFQDLQAPKVDLNTLPVILKSDAMNKFFSQLMLVAPTDATVLIQGETGTGKDIFARQVHGLSSRLEKPFIKIDCSSLPENLIEAELFGYVAGSFSGANSKGKVGLIEAASGGTVFLDEIGELPLLMQSRLLRVLQNREVVRIGSTTPSPIDIRFIAATNRNLLEEQEKGRFRSDLYYRLNVANFTIPPLRERKEDIVPMAQTFLNHFSTRYSRHITLSQEAEDLLSIYSWPGNVRELENMMHNLASSRNGGKIYKEDLPVLRSSSNLPLAVLARTPVNTSLKARVNIAEKSILEEALAHCKTTKELCSYLSVNRTTLIRKMQMHNLTFEAE